MSKHNDAVRAYYETLESRIGYAMLLGGTRHFGFYELGDNRWNFPRALRRMEDQLGQEMSLPEGSLVLDAGCGEGAVSRRLHKRFGLRVRGIDLVSRSIRTAQRAGAMRQDLDSLQYQVMDYQELDFSDNTFDGAYTMETLVHSNDPRQALGEFYRVLKPGGRVVLFEYSHDRDLSKDEDKMLRRINEMAALDSFTNFSADSVEQILLSAGFEEICTREITPNILPMVQCFHDIARIPRLVVGALGLGGRFVNSLSAVEFWKMRGRLHYNVHTAIKPGRAEGSLARKARPSR